MGDCIGYCRVSSTGQSLDIQLARLQQYGCVKVYRETASGLRSDRPVLRDCLEYIRETETLVITKIDRLARSTLDLCQIVARLKHKGVGLIVLDQHIDLHTASGELTFHMLAAIAQFETSLRRDRQMEGIRAAQAKGVPFGRARQLTPQDVQELHRLRALGVPVKELRQIYHLSRASIYRYLDEAIVASEESA